MTKQAAIETIKKYLAIGARNGAQVVMFNQKQAFEDGAVKAPAIGEPDVLVGGTFEIVDGQYECSDTGDRFDTLDSYVDSVAEYLSGRCKKEILA